MIKGKKNKEKVLFISNKIGCEVKDLEKSLSNIQWYYKEIIRLYLRIGSYRKLTKTTKIPLHSVIDSVNYGCYLAKYEILKRKVYKSI